MALTRRSAGNNKAPRTGFSIVLGGGGSFGIAYHAGALKAVQEVGGLNPDDASLVIGTSAGAVIGAGIRNGMPLDQLALLSESEPETDGSPPPSFMIPAWRTTSELVRRTIGASWVISRSLARIPMPDPPGVLKRLFPGGMFDVRESESMAELPDEWPEKDLWLIAMDINSGKRIPLGRDRSPHRLLDLPDAVMASCSVPGLYRPVKLGNCMLVDGGVHSSTNLDLAARHDAAVVIALGPLASDPGLSGRSRSAIRRRWTRAMTREAAVVERAGAEVLMLRPGEEELKLAGRNILRSQNSEAVMTAAYDTVARILTSERGERLLDLARSGEVVSV